MLTSILGRKKSLVFKYKDGEEIEGSRQESKYDQTILFRLGHNEAWLCMSCCFLKACRTASTACPCLCYFAFTLLGSRQWDYSSCLPDQLYTSHDSHNFQDNSTRSAQRIVRQSANWVIDGYCFSPWSMEIRARIPSENIVSFHHSFIRQNESGRVTEHGGVLQ